MNENSYVGREYLTSLLKNNIKVDVITFGNHPIIDEAEENRCGGLWKPKKQEFILNFFSFFLFKSLNSKELDSFLLNQNYDLAIQGGTGILKNNIIKKFKYGILNFHPGDLPKYRGCSAPEWQLYERQKIISTCHLIDIGIDTGRVLFKKELNVSLESYELFRASIYPETSKFLIDIINKITLNPRLIEGAKQQDETVAEYREYIGEPRISILKHRFLNNQL